MLGESGLDTAQPLILPKNYHIGVYGTTHEPYTGAVLRYAITDRRLFSPKSALRRLARRDEGQAELVRRCGELARDGIDYIQLREKDLSAGEVVHLGKAVLAAIRAAGGHTRLLVNVENDAAAALSIGADGVHLTIRAQDSPETVLLRYEQAGLPRPFVSMSCHSPAEVMRARRQRVSAILYGPVFGKRLRNEQGEDVEVVEGVGLGELAVACGAALSTPVFALGGVTEANAAACVAAGAAGIAAIRAFMLP